MFKDATAAARPPVCNYRSQREPRGEMIKQTGPVLQHQDWIRLEPVTLATCCRAIKESSRHVIYGSLFYNKTKRL